MSSSPGTTLRAGGAQKNPMHHWKDHAVVYAHFSFHSASVRGTAAAPKKPIPNKHTLREQEVLKIMRLPSALHRWRALQETMLLKAFVSD